MDFQSIVVYLTFLIEKDGKLDNIKVLRGISKECDEEAVRIVKLMPKWKFVQQKKNPEAVQFNMPIKFTLDTLKK